MAESESSFRVEWLQLLKALKTTVEGLLAMQSFNVWSTYGGLPRLCHRVQAILNHRLKVTQGKFGSCLDYWNFVRGIRWLNPVLSPSIEQLNRLASCSEDHSLSPGQVWVQQSLLNHNLRAQLQILVANQAHLHKYYEDDAFLAQADYFQAMVICLEAVEQNDAALLAEINPNLLSSTLRKKKKVKLKSTHVRSASLPVNQVSETVMIRRARTQDHLAPPLSPKTESVLSTTLEYAIPNSGSSPESAKEALLQILSKSGSPLDFEDDCPSIKTKEIDPLMQLEVCTSDQPLLSVHSSNTALNTVIHKSKQYKSGMRRSHSAQLNNNNTGCEEKETMRSRASSKSSGLLDKILNDDDWVKEAIDSDMQMADSSAPGDRELNNVAVVSESCHDLRSNTSHPADLTATTTTQTCAPDSATQTANKPQPSTSSHKRPTHHRSVSDFGLPRKPSVMADVPRKLSLSPEPAVLSSSLPSGNNTPDGYFPRPAEGQSLMSFLSSQDFHTCAELDKENAHFSISEALIAAIEQMKWNKIIRPRNDSEQEGESDEEIQELRQRIRIRKRERMIEKARGFPAFSDGRTDTTPTTSSASPNDTQSGFNSSYSQDSSEGSSEDIHDAEINDSEEMENKSTNLTSLKESGLSLSLASLYSDADLRQNNTLSEKRDALPEKQKVYLELPMISAESVAISLLKKFSEKQLPKASDLQWLVSEQDAPQTLLPLPNSYPVSPDEGENADLVTSKRMRIRGNLDWAPPRAQIIFNIHPPPKRKVVLAKQNYRCAGCGAKVEPGYMKRYRYCEYLGKYFCPRCHTNAESLIPGRILRKWDFTKYSVSKFAYDLLWKIKEDPLFNVQDINSSLYRKVRSLDLVRECRVQLSQLRLFLQSCRLGQELYEVLQKCRAHWFDDLHLYSVNELVQIKKGDHLDELRCLVNDCITHISQCPLCQAKGFICELCDETDLLFPFQLQKVAQCTVCHACYHKDCFYPDKCPRCIRIEARKFRLSQKSPEHGSEEIEGDAGIGAT